MPRSCTGIIPSEYNTQRDLPAVKAWLQAFPADPQDKEELLFSWARNVGLKLTTADYNAVKFYGEGT
jgi:hypothetical protein